MAMMVKASTPNRVPEHDDTTGTARQSDSTGTGTKVDPIDVDDTNVPTDHQTSDLMMLKDLLAKEKVAVCDIIQKRLQLNQPDPKLVEIYAKRVTEVLSKNLSTDLALAALNVVYALCLKDGIFHASKIVRIQLINAIIRQAEPVSVRAGAILDILWDVVPTDVLGVLRLGQYASPFVAKTFLPRLTREVDENDVERGYNCQRCPCHDTGCDGVGADP